MGLTTRAEALPPITALGAGAPLDVRYIPMYRSAIYIFGTFSATVQIEASHDGGTWFILKDTGGNPIAGVTSPGGNFPVAGEARFLRINCPTTFVSGKVEAVLCTVESA